jgi:hypothetical protein
MYCYMSRPTPVLSLTADHVSYTVKAQTNEHSNIRLWAIQKQCPANEAEYQYAMKLALYWYYHHKLGCKYNAAIQRKLHAIDLVR